MYYSGKNDIFGTWSTNITYADLLNIFEAKQIVRKYKFKNYDLVKIKGKR